MDGAGGGADGVLLLDPVAFADGEIAEEMAAAMAAAAGADAGIDARR